MKENPICESVAVTCAYMYTWVYWVAMEIVFLNVWSNQKRLGTHSTMSHSSCWCNSQTNIYWYPNYWSHDPITAWTYTYSETTSTKREKNHGMYRHTHTYSWTLTDTHITRVVKAFCSVSHSYVVLGEFGLMVFIPSLTSWVGCFIN